MLGDIATGNELSEKDLEYVQSDLQLLIEGLLPHEALTFGSNTGYIVTNNGQVEELWVSNGFRLTDEYTCVWDGIIRTREEYLVELGINPEHSLRYNPKAQRLIRALDHLVFDLTYEIEEEKIDIDHVSKLQSITDQLVDEIL